MWRGARIEADMVVTVACRHDRLSPRLQARSTNGLFGWEVEAEWGPDGATCVGDELRMSLYDSRQVSYELPGCLADLGGRSNCGSLPTSRPTSKIANSYCHLWETLGVSVCNLHNDDRG